MVDSPAPVSRMKGYGPWSPMHTSRVSATCPATTLTVNGTFSPPPGCAVAPLQLAAAGGRAKVTCGSTWIWTVAARWCGPLTAAARTSTSTVITMATSATMSRPRRAGNVASG